MAEKSLFAVLLRSPWWISIALTLGFVLAAKALLPAQYFVYGALGGLPFAVIGVIAAYRLLRAPSTAHVPDTLAQIGALSWRDFSSLIEQAFRRDGYEVQRLEGTTADFSAIKAGRTTLLSCKRWKAARLGQELFESLEVARSKRDADAALCITMGEVTENARQFAATHHIRVMQGTELAQLLRPALRAKPKN